MKSANHTKKRANQNVCWGRACCLVQNGFSRKSSLSSQNVPRSAWIAGGCVGHCFKKSSNVQNRSNSMQRAIGKNPDRTENTVNWQLFGKRGTQKHDIQKNIRFGSQAAYRAADCPQNGASEHAKYRQVAPDTLQRASGADAGQSPTVSVRCHFWSASGSGAG